MHELSAARNIVEIVSQHVPPHDLGRVRRVKVRIGELAGILPSSLVFCFDAVVSETSMKEAQLEVDAVPASAVCTACGSEFRIDSPVFACPHCGHQGLGTGTGSEFHIVEIELQDIL
jgi:hydrogenase nickel incorporation protein HypA/HybF